MDSNLFSLYQKRRHSGACKPFQVRLTASIAVGHATDREHVQVVVPTVKGAFGIQGRHRFDSDASHSAPSTRQDGAHNVKQAKEKGNEQQEKQDAEIHTLGRMHRK